MQQLPQLNTGTNDISNTLLNLAKFKEGKESNDLQNENTKKRNALLDIQLSDEVRENQNALAKLTLKTEQARLEELTAQNKARAFEDLIKAVTWTDVTVKAGDPSAYDVLREDSLNRGYDAAYFPPSSVFYDEKPDLSGPNGRTKLVFNNEKFSNYTNQIKSLAKEKFAASKPVTVKGRKGEGADTKDVTLVWDEGKGEFIEVTSGSAFAPTKSEKDAEMTPGQKATRQAADTKRLTEIGLKLNAVDKNDYSLVVDEVAGGEIVSEYNEIAERLGKKDRYVWKEDGIEVEKDSEGGIIGFAKSIPGKVGKLFTGKGEVEKIGGWVKVKVDKDGNEIKEEATPEEATNKASGKIDPKTGKTVKVRDAKTTAAIIAEAEKAANAPGADVEQIRKKLEATLGMKVTY